MKSAIVKRSIVIDGHKTSISMEDDFWMALKEIAGERGRSLASLIANIDAERIHRNLSSAVRRYVLGYYRERAAGAQQYPRPQQPASPSLQHGYNSSQYAQAPMPRPSMWMDDSSE